MQLSQLEYLQAVANYGGVRKAARAVHVSPQAVSSAIKKLESEYQIVLLDRSAGEAVLSPAGREFARRARVILAQVDDLKKYAQSGNGGVSPDGHFRLYAPCLLNCLPFLGHKKWEAFLWLETLCTTSG